MRAAGGLDVGSTVTLSLLKILTRQKSEQMAEAQMAEAKTTSCDEPAHGAGCTISGYRA